MPPTSRKKREWVTLESSGFFGIRQISGLEIERDARLVIAGVHQPATAAHELPILIA
jgi:hypothetical protein